MDLTKSYEFFQPDTATEKIHIVGCGSVGATVAENLARFGLTNMVLWDFDEVSPHNVANQIFTNSDIGKAKTEALAAKLIEINPDIKGKLQIQSNGWQGKMMSGYIILAVDNIDLRKKIVEKHMHSPYVKAVFDFRTRLTDAQHYAADWSDTEQKDNLLKSMDFTNEEADSETPMSACGVSLSVCPTIRGICALGVSNIINTMKGVGTKKLILLDAFNFDLMAF